MGVSINGSPIAGSFFPWAIMENPIKMDDLGIPKFQETSIYQTINLAPAGTVVTVVELEPLRRQYGQGQSGR